MSAQEQEIARVNRIQSEQYFVEEYFKAQGEQVRVIASESYMKKSAATYNEAWILREIAQNFIDHNKNDRHTLNGVDIEIIPLDNEEFEVFISGNWPFSELTGLLSPHSDKSDSPGKTAGGNGIGLKQAVIRLVRDFGVRDFIIEGNGWDVEYFLVKADEINRNLTEPSNVGLIRHNWFAAKISDASQREEKNSYRFKTKNVELVSLLTRLKEIGVCNENPFLQNLDFQTPKLKLKFARSDKEDELLLPTGTRFFVNGQVMNVQTSGKTSHEYWHGAAGFTASVQDADYEMSVDRPPFQASVAAQLVTNELRKITFDECVHLLKASEQLWGLSYQWSDAIFDVLSFLVNRLYWSSEFKPTDFRKIFGQDKKYIVTSSAVSTDQEKKLKNDGWTVLPRFFGKIGVPLFSDIFISADHEVEKRQIYSADVVQRLKYKPRFIRCFQFDLPKYSSDQELAEHLFSYIGKYMGSEISNIIFSDNTMIIKLNRDPFSASLLSSYLNNNGSTSEKLLLFIGGLFKTFDTAIQFDSFATYFHGTYQTQYLPAENLSLDEILVQTTEQATTRSGLYIHMSSEMIAILKEMWEQKNFELSPRVVKEGERINSPGGSTKAVPQSAGPSQYEDKSSDVLEDRLRQGVPEAVTKIKPDGDQAEKLAGEKKTSSSEEKAAGKAKKVNKKIRNILARVKPQKKRFTVKNGIIVEDQSENAQTDPEKPRTPQTVEEKIKPVTQHIAEALELVVNQLEEGVIPVLDKLIDDQENNETQVIVPTLTPSTIYLNGVTLTTIVNQALPTVITAIQKSYPDLKTQEALSVVSRAQLLIKTLIDALSEPEHSVDEFQLVEQPTAKEMHRLSLLREWVYLAIGVAIPNGLFIYTGNGSFGININREAIGLHRNLIAGDFHQALGVFTHELAHNEIGARGHDASFARVHGALHTQLLQNALNTLNTLKTSVDEELLSEKDLRLIEIIESWNTDDF